MVNVNCCVFLLKARNMMNEKWNQYFFGEPTEEEKRELFQELEKNEDMKREFAEMQNIVGRPVL